MNTHSPLFLLAALGLLSSAGSALAVDTSDWKCESCPYPKGASATIEAGVVSVSGEPGKYGDFTGLDRERVRAVVGGGVRYRGDAGYFAEVQAADVGLDTVRLGASSGHEGLFSLSAAYAELPRHFASGAQTPFLGVGGNVLTLPTGFQAASTSGMPLASTLKPVDIGFKKSRMDLGAKVVAIDNWVLRVNVSRDKRDGTRPLTSSFFASAAQLVAPVDQVTDQLEVSAAYTTRSLQASLAYTLSRFNNAYESLTWDSPFWAVVPGATRGQLALAPNNEMHQISGSAGYEILPGVRASGDFAIGRQTQNASYLMPTLNTQLGVGAASTSSLDGKVGTFNSNLKLTASPLDDLRLTALYAHNERNNNTSINSYQGVATDIFVAPALRSNTPFSNRQDRARFNADYRGFEGVKLAAGIEQDNRERTYSEALKTRESTLWARLGVQAREDLNLSLKFSHADRKHSDYGIAIWFDGAESPLLRKYNLAERQRDSAGLRADWSVSEGITVGASADYANDDYEHSAVGLNVARSVSFGLDVSAALSEQTQVNAFVQNESVRSRQSGTEGRLAIDWRASNKDRFDLVGVGIRHKLIVDKFDVGADVSVSRAYSEMRVDTSLDAPLFPAARTSRDTTRIFGDYKLSDKLALVGNVQHERYSSADWRLDGVLPGTLPNLLSFGQQAPNYSVTQVALSMRYKF